MDGELSIYNIGPEVSICYFGEESCATLIADDAVFRMALTSKKLTSANLRQIADKLDELNRKETADAGH